MTTKAFLQDCQIEELRAELRSSLDPKEVVEIEAELRALLTARDCQSDSKRPEA